MKFIPLTNSDRVAIVDDADFDSLVAFPWREHVCKRTSYAIRSWRRREDGKVLSIYMHRQITNAPDGLEVDHADLNGLNNQRSNLEVMTQQQNNARKGPSSKCKSGLKGVWQQGGSWVAEIHIGKSRKFSLGSYRNKYHAAIAYNSAALSIHGRFAYQNPIPEGQATQDEMLAISARAQIAVAAATPAAAE